MPGGTRDKGGALFQCKAKRVKFVHRGVYHTAREQAAERFIGKKQALNCAVIGACSIGVNLQIKMASVNLHLDDSAKLTRMAVQFRAYLNRKEADYEGWKRLRTIVSKS